MSGATRRPLLEAAGISKRFGNVRALHDVSLTVAAGEVHGLVGANGAGKSTLIGILSGAVRPDSGTLRVAGKEVPLGSLSAARAAGLAVVHQELMLFPDRTVEENVFASVVPAGAFRWIGARSRRERVEAAVARLGAVVGLKSRLGELPLAQRQLVEIARALCSGGTVLFSTSRPRRCRSRRRKDCSMPFALSSLRMQLSSSSPTASMKSSDHRRAHCAARWVHRGKLEHCRCRHCHDYPRHGRPACRRAPPTAVAAGRTR